MIPQKFTFDSSKPKVLQIKISGEWQLYSGLPSHQELFAGIKAYKNIEELEISADSDFKWDSAFISFLLAIKGFARERNIRLSLKGFPPQVEKLLKIGEYKTVRSISRVSIEEPFLERVGTKILEARSAVFSVLDFLGDNALVLIKFLRRKAFFRKEDFFVILQRCGVDALLLVSLISILVGMILAFIGAIQLKLLGAQVYIADIVGIAMVRVMGAVMTGVIMSGRTGASFAAELGIMQANEEIDALKTLGVSPVEFLVMPRVLALVLMMPLLTLYANLMGIAGGFIIGVGMLDLNYVEYYNHTINSVKLSNLSIGLIHGFVFGIVIALSGCYKGMRCQRSSQGVGEATTSAVVTAITAIVIATAIITYVCQVIGV